MKKKNGLKKAFFWMMALFAIIVLVPGVSSCVEDLTNSQARSMSVDTVPPVVTGYIYETLLRHQLDSVLKTEVGDNMTAEMTIWTASGGEKIEKVFYNREYPKLKAYSDLARRDYTISPDMVDIRPISETIARAPESTDAEGHVLELDTVLHAYPDAQLMSVPVKITNHTVEYGGHVYNYPSVTLIGAEFVHLKNTPVSAKARTRGTYVSDVYDTEYKINLVLQEKNVQGSPKTFRLPVYAYTTRSVLEDDAIDKVTAENKLRVLLDSLTERCSFDRVTTYKSGDVIRDNISIILYHKVGKIDPYKKEVKNTDYFLEFVNPIKRGTEVQNRVENNWTVWRTEDTYSSQYGNGYASEKIVPPYTLMHERCTYKDDHLQVDFDYEDYRVEEKKTTVTPVTSDRSGYSEAIFDNHIMTYYIAHPQEANELVYLYVPDAKAVDHKIENPQLVVYRDSVVGDVDFVTIFSDGTKDKVHDHINVPKTLRCLTNWESVQKFASQVTEDDVRVNLISSEDAASGYWKYVKQVRQLNADATLYDNSKMNNRWESVVPNSFSYVRDGVTYKFDNISFAAKQIGATLKERGESGGFTLYDYADEINVTYGKDAQRSVAPGLVKLSNNAVIGYDIRNKSLSITPEKVTASLDFITKFANGTEGKERISKDFPRSLVVTTNWTAYENSGNESTASPSFIVAQTQNKEDSYWNWKEETRNISAVATLASSTQTNGWTSVDPNSITYTREGVKADFGNFTFKVVKVSSNATLSNSEPLTDTYSYTNTISASLENSMASNSQNSTAPGKIVVQKSRQVTGHEFRNPKLTITDDYVRASLTYVTLFNDGTETTEPVSHDFSRSLNPYTNWTANEKNADELTGSASVKLTSSEKLDDGNWGYTRETRDITAIVTLANSKQTNGWTSVDPNAITYTRDGKTYAFDKINFSAQQADHHVQLANETSTVDTYSYSDKINVIYGSNTKSSTAPGTIKVEKEVFITDYEISDPKLTVNKDNVIASLKWITIYSDGTKKSEDVSKTFPRSFKVLTDWSSTEKDDSQSTGSATVNLTNSSSQTDGNWRYVRETRNITTIAKLAGSSQENKWESIDPNSIVFERNGKKHDFGKINFNATEAGATVKQKNDDAKSTVYGYTSNISVTYGSNSFNSSAPGTITVLKEVTVVDYEISDPKLTVNKDNVVASLKWITIYSDGTKKSEDFSKTFDRSFKVLTNWSSTEKDNTQSTGSANVSLTNSSNQIDGNWRYVRETRNITTIAKLNGSSQENKWESIDPNSIVFERNGKKHDFGKINFNATETGATVKQKSDDAKSTVYSYTDNISVTYGSNSFNSSAPGTITVLKEVTVTDYQISDPKLTVNKDNVTASLKWVTIYSDGTKKSEDVSKTFPRSFKVLTDWSSKEKSNSQSTGAATVNLTNSSSQTDGNWRYVRETRNITTIAKLAGSSQENKWESIDPNSIVFERNGKKHDFGKINFDATETGATVKQKSDDAKSTVYSYTDKISVTYGSNSFNSSAPGTITVPKEVTVVDYEISNPKLTVNKDNVTASLKWVTIYSDGTKKSEDVSKTFNRRFNVLTDWSSKEKSNSQNTGSATVNLTNSTDKTDGNWRYTRETRTITTIAKLAGSSQENRWESVDPNSIVFERNGKKHDFGKINFDATEIGATVKQKSDNDDETVYSYTDKISVTYGSNSFNSSAPGTITVEKQWNPDIDDKFTAACVTATLDETHKSWVYVVSVQMTKGTQAILIQKGASKPDPIEKGAYTTSTDKRLNSAYYVNNKWFNCIADDMDSAKAMYWKDVSESSYGMLVYSTATVWGWDYGHTRNGHPTVFTDRYSVKLSNNNRVLTIYDASGKVFATYKGKK